MPNERCDEAGRSKITDVLGAAAVAVGEGQTFDACQLSSPTTSVTTTATITTTATTTSAHGKLTCMREPGAQSMYLVGLRDSSQARDCGEQATLVNQILEVCDLFVLHQLRDAPGAIGSPVGCVTASTGSSAGATASRQVLRVRPNREGVASCEAIGHLLDSTIDQYTLLPREVEMRPGFICLPGNTIILFYAQARVCRLIIPTCFRGGDSLASHDQAAL